MIPKDIENIIMDFIGLQTCTKCRCYTYSTFIFNGRCICENCLKIMLNFLYTGLKYTK